MSDRDDSAFSTKTFGSPGAHAMRLIDALSTARLLNSCSLFSLSSLADLSHTNREAFETRRGWQGIARDHLENVRNIAHPVLPKLIASAFTEGDRENAVTAMGGFLVDFAYYQGVHTKTPWLKLAEEILAEPLATSKIIEDFFVEAAVFTANHPSWRYSASQCLRAMVNAISNPQLRASVVENVNAIEGFNLTASMKAAEPTQTAGEPATPATQHTPGGRRPNAATIHTA